MSQLLQTFLWVDGALLVAVLTFMIIKFSFSFYKKPARVMTENVEIEDHSKEPVKELIIGGLEEVMELKRQTEDKAKKEKTKKTNKAKK
jgi:hypothetical protein